MSKDPEVTVKIGETYSFGGTSWKIAFSHKQDCALTMYSPIATTCFLLEGALAAHIRTRISLTKLDLGVKV